jgi:uncharacterized membrane protein YdjX (TVP38/TMEM64 family)
MFTNRPFSFPLTNKNQISSRLGWIVGASLGLVLLWRYRQPVGAFLAFLQDREAVTVYLHQLGAVGPLVLAFLLALQVVLGSISGQILLISAGYVYGFWPAFWLNLLTIVGTSQLVFGLARWWGRPLVTRAVPAAILNKWMPLAEQKGMGFFCLAFMTPIVPGDFLNYVAGLTPLSGWRFAVANVCGRVPSTLIGATGVQLTLPLITSFLAVGLLAIGTWVWFVKR